MVTNSRLMDFLFSLDGKDYLLACLLARGWSYTEIESDTGWTPRTISRIKVRLRDAWVSFVEEEARLDSEEEAEGGTEEESSEIAQIFSEAAERLHLCPFDRL